jgi:nickel-dependent lactate racemase
MKADFSGGFQKQDYHCFEDDKRFRNRGFYKAKKTALTNFHLPEDEKLIKRVNKNRVKRKKFSKEVGEEAKILV